MNSPGSSSDWLSALAPERAPAVPGWWPPAPGWWIVAIVLIAGLVTWLQWWHQPRRRLRRLALRELRRIRARALDEVATARALQNLLRRYALAVFGADRVARLNGSEWLGFVAAHGAELLAGPLGEALLVASFSGRGRSGDAADCDAWCAAVEGFVRQAATVPSPSQGRTA